MIENIRSITVGSFQDFLNSKYYTGKSEKLSSAPIRKYQRFYETYRKLEDMSGETLYIIFSGKAELLKYIKEFINLDNLYENEECIRVVFDEFSVYTTVLLKTNTDGDFERLLPVLLMDRRIIWCSRKSPCTTYPTPIPMMIIDKYSNSWYILPELRYPNKEKDQFEFIKWLRLKKQALYVRYMSDDYNINHWCYYPRFADRWIAWQKQANILVGDDVFVELEIKSDSSPAVIIDYRKGEVTSFKVYDYLHNLKIKDPFNITQDTVDEFVNWQNNRYKILK